MFPAWPLETRAGQEQRLDERSEDDCSFLQGNGFISWELGLKKETDHLMEMEEFWM